jgi:CRISPR system Cascade subunit CasD
MDFLVFQLQAPLSSWGDPAVGEYRGTAEHPSQSALVGLLGAALGLLRTDESAHAALRDDYGYAVGLLSGGRLLRDFQTAQVPPTSKLKGRPHATRRQELAVPKHDLGTILSTRDYRQDGASLVAVAVRDSHFPRYTLTQLAQALRTPVFTLYLGRRACPPGTPLWPQLISCDSALTALTVYRDKHEQARHAAAKVNQSAPLEALATVQRLYFDDHITAGHPAMLTTLRKDRLIRRGGWQFGDRPEHMAVLPTEEI